MEYRLEYKKAVSIQKKEKEEESSICNVTSSDRADHETLVLI